MRTILANTGKMGFRRETLEVVGPLGGLLLWSIYEVMWPEPQWRGKREPSEDGCRGACHLMDVELVDGREARVPAKLLKSFLCPDVMLSTN